MHSLKEIRHECSTGRDTVACSLYTFRPRGVFTGPTSLKLTGSTSQPNDPGYIISLIFNLKNSFSDSSDISAHVHTLLQINTNTIKSVC